MFRATTYWHALVSIVVLPMCALAQDKKDAVTDPAKADADFAVQGEYTGELPGNEGKEKWGIQVVALGDGKFEAVGYKGGLPGDGWDKGEKAKGRGETAGGVTTLVGDKGGANIKGGVLAVIDNDGNQIGQMNRVVRKSPTLGMKPPQGAVVLFDGKTADNFAGGRMTDDGLLMQGATSKQKFNSLTLHLEFMTPYMPHARGQGRSNSGCYLQGRYEVQILDSFGLDGKNNECGGIYSIRDPDVNMCLPPLSWQTYDIDYTPAKYNDAGKKLKNAVMTVRHNGVVVHPNAEIPKDTTGAPVSEGPEPGPIYLQDHGNPVRFRNIWVVEKK